MDVEDVAVVEQPVEDRGGHDPIAEDLAPFAKPLLDVRTMLPDSYHGGADPPLRGRWCTETMGKPANNEGSIYWRGKDRRWVAAVQLGLLPRNGHRVRRHSVPGPRPMRAGCCAMRKTSENEGRWLAMASEQLGSTWNGG